MQGTRNFATKLYLPNGVLASEVVPDWGLVHVHAWPLTVRSAISVSFFMFSAT